MKLVFVLVLCVIIIAGVSGRPCGRCIGQDGYCGDGSGSCVIGTKCSSLREGGARICLPTANIGDECFNKPYTPCAALHFCDPNLKTCQFNSGIARITDACNNDDDCAGALACVDKRCANTANDQCTSSHVGCPIDQFCDLQTNPANPTCKKKGGVNSDCNSNNDCWLSSCISGSCRDWFTAVELADCTSLRDCKLGLQCERRVPDTETKCHKPLLYFVNGPGERVWGRECDAAREGGVGCTCNNDAGVEMLLYESSPIYGQSCADALVKYDECRAEAGCYQTASFEGSCDGRNCYAEKIAFENACTYFGHPPARCSANDMVIALCMILALLLL